MQDILLSTGDAMESKPDVVLTFTCGKIIKKNLQHAECGHRAVETE